MSIIDENQESKTVLKRRLPLCATAHFNDNGNIVKLEVIVRRTLTIDNAVIECSSVNKTVYPNASNTELTTRLTRIDNAVEWVIKNM